MGDPASFYAVNFFSELIKLVRYKKIALRVLQGTRSHDLNQLQIFKHYEEDITLDFQIIETAQLDELCGLNVLYLPEEYPENDEEYYLDYKQNEYDIIFSHGTWDFLAQPGQIENAKKSTHSAPVFIWKEWKQTIPNGFISSGHIHGRNVYSTKIYYSGSFSRWNYGERSAKGFTYIEFDKENSKYKVEFIDNNLAPKYEVFSVKELEIDLDTTECLVIQEMLDAQIGDSETDHLRIDLSGLSKEKIEILKEYYGKRPNVKIEVRDNRSVMLKESKESQKAEFEKYKYITKRQLPLNETIKRFCKEELNTDLELSKIDNILKPE